MAVVSRPSHVLLAARSHAAASRGFDRSGGFARRPIHFIGLATAVVCVFSAVFALTCGGTTPHLEGRHFGVQPAAVLSGVRGDRQPSDVAVPSFSRQASAKERGHSRGLSDISWVARLGIACLAGIAAVLGALRRGSRFQRGLRVACGVGEDGGVDARHSVQSAPKRPSLTIAGLHSACLVLVFLFFDIAVYVVGESASQAPAHETVLLLSALASVILGTSVSYMKRGWEGLLQSLDYRHVVRLLPVSALFCISMLGLLFAFEHFDSAFIKLLGQMKLPLTAFLSVGLLGRSYSILQWQVILLICATCMSFTAVKIGSLPDRSVNAFGALCVVVWVFSNVLGSLLSERALKLTLPFEAVMTHMRAGETLTLLVLLVFKADFRWQGFFHGWDWTTVSVLTTIFVDSWLAGLMVKRLSSVTKNVTKCASIVTLYVIAVGRGTQPFALTQGLGALMIIQSSVLFAIVSTQKQLPVAPARPPCDATLGVTQ